MIGLDIFAVINGRDIVAKEEEFKLLVTWNQGSRLQLWEEKDGPMGKGWYEIPDEARTLDEDRPTRVDAERVGSALLELYVESLCEDDEEPDLDLKQLFRSIADGYTEVVKCVKEEDDRIVLSFITQDSGTPFADVEIRDASFVPGRKNRLVSIQKVVRERGKYVASENTDPVLVSPFVWAILAVVEKLGA